MPEEAAGASRAVKAWNRADRVEADVRHDRDRKSFVDVHRYTCEEAAALARRTFGGREPHAYTDGFLDFLIGRGLHSEKGRVELQKAVCEALCKLRYTEDRHASAGQPRTFMCIANAARDGIVRIRVFLPAELTATPDATGDPAAVGDATADPAAVEPACAEPAERSAVRTSRRPRVAGACWQTCRARWARVPPLCGRRVCRPDTPPPRSLLRRLQRLQGF